MQLGNSYGFCRNRLAILRSCWPSAAILFVIIMLFDTVLDSLGSIEIAISVSFRETTLDSRHYGTLAKSRYCRIGMPGSLAVLHYLGLFEGGWAFYFDKLMDQQSS